MIKKLLLTEAEDLKLTSLIDKRIAELTNDHTFASKSEESKKLHRLEMKLWKKVFYQLI